MGNGKDDVGWGTIDYGTHVGQDDRRHKTWCEHFRKSDGTCWCQDPGNGYFEKKCPGSAHCSFYSPNENASVPVQNESGETENEKPIVRFTWKSFIGKPIVHPAYGKGTIIDADDDYLTVLFETVGTKRFSAAWCAENGLIRVQSVINEAEEIDYQTLLAKLMEECPTDEQNGDGKPTPPPIGHTSPEALAGLRSFIEEHTQRVSDVSFGEPVCADDLDWGSVCGERRQICMSPPPRRDKRFSLPPLKPSFQKQFLLKMIERDMTAVDCYTRANIDRKLFSKIFSSETYKPRKETAIALIMTLSPTEREMDDLLKALGYCLSESNLFDLVIEYCVRNRIYDLFDVNDYLYEMDLPLLGSCE